jgi:hypothetical protein
MAHSNELTVTTEIIAEQLPMRGVPAENVRRNIETDAPM